MTGVSPLRRAWGLGRMAPVLAAGGELAHWRFLVLVIAREMIQWDLAQISIFLELGLMPTRGLYFVILKVLDSDSNPLV